MTADPTRSVRPITGRTVLFGMIAFFGVIMAVNAAFVYFALNSWPGLSSDQAYEDGLAYNKTLQAAAVQKSLGWTSALNLTDDGAINVQVLDKLGLPVRGLDISLRMLRPTHEQDDLSPELMEVSEGLYTANLANIARGQWRAELTVKNEGKTQFFVIHDMMIE